jgi:hypothetical protein
MSLNVTVPAGAKLTNEKSLSVSVSDQIDSNTNGPSPWDRANFTGMTALPFALKLLEPSALIGC